MILKSFLKNNLLRIIFVLIGALAGFLYWKFIGCESGTCRIKSVWYWSTLYGMIFGYLIGDLIASFLERRKRKNNSSSESSESLDK